MAQTKEVAKAAKLDLAVLANDSKDVSGFGNLDLSRDLAILTCQETLQSLTSTYYNPIVLNLIRQKRNTLKGLKLDSSIILSHKKSVIHLT